MKLKDIEVGKDYAIGAPNATYDEWRRVRGRIVKAGVHGVTGNYCYSHMSDRPTYVEFEVIQDDEAGTLGIKYQHSIVKDPAHAATMGERTPGRSFHGERKPVVSVTRCLATNVLVPWDEYLEAKAEHDVEAEESRKRKEAESNRKDSIMSRFDKLGLLAFQSWPSGGIRFSVDDAEKILERLEKV